MADEESTAFASGSVVWYQRNTQTGWWPCLVTETSDEDVSRVYLQALGDDHDYGWVDTASQKLLPFDCVECKEKAQKQISRLQKARRKNTLSKFVKAVKDALDHDPSLQLDIKLPDVSTIQLPPPLSTPQSPPDIWSVLNDSSIFTPGSSSKPGRITRSSLKRSMASNDLPISPTASHSIPPGTTESAKSDILVGCNSSQWKKQKKCGENGSVSRRKRQKADRLSDEEDATGQSNPVRKKLELDDATCNADILATCETLPGSPQRKTMIKSENVPVKQGSRIAQGLEEVHVFDEKEKGENMIEASVVDVDVDGERTVMCGSIVPPVENGESCKVMDEAESGVRGGVVEDKEEKVEGERGEEHGKEGEESEEREAEQDKGETWKEEEEGEGGSTSSDDEDLPVLLPNTSTKVVINELKEGDYIWCKWSRYPHWPALVVKVNHTNKKKTNATARINFFGYSDKQQLRIKHGHKIAWFVRGNKQFYDFMKVGRESNMSVLFIKSVNEAESFIQAKSKKELTGSASEMFTQICERRPASETLNLEMDMSLSEDHSEVPKFSAFGVPLDSELMGDEDGESGSDAGEIETESEVEDSLYSVDKVLDYFTELKPVLEGIICGSTPSEYHRLFTSGTARERYNLGNCRKFGPCVGWNTDKKVKLIHHLEKMAKQALSVEDGQFQYARDVLLPEAMIRTICHFEDISEVEAEEKL